MLQLTSPTPGEGRAVPVRVLRLGALLWLVGLVLCGLITQWYASVNDRRINRQFDVELQRLVDLIDVQLRSYEKGIRGTRGALLVGGQEHISAENYRIYAQSRDLAVEFPGARGFGYIRRVPADGIKAYIAEVRGEGDRRFDIRQLAPHDGEVDVIHRIGPLQPNRDLVGLDIASDPNRHMAAREAMDNGTATMTGLIAPDRTLDAGMHSFMILLPVYRPDMATQTVQQRHAATFGWAFVLLDAEEALRAITLADDMQVSIRDSAAGPFLTLGHLASPASVVLRRTQAVDLYGRHWSFTAVAGARYVEGLGFTAPWKIFATGALITLLLSALRAGQWAAGLRRHELQAQHALLVSLVANSTDAIVGESLDGKVVSWNAEAAAKFGYTAEEAIGQPVVGLILPRERAAEDAELLALSGEGQRVPPFDTTRSSKDGTLIHVSVTAIPVTGRDGRISVIVKTIRDISERKAAENALKAANIDLERQVDSRGAQLNSVRRDLQTLLDAMPSLIGYWDKNLINRFANRAYLSFADVGLSSIAGLPMREVLGEALFDDTRAHRDAVFRGESPTFDVVIPDRASGKNRHWLAHYIPDLVDGGVQGFYVMVHDITEVTESKQRLLELMRENDALLSTLQTYALVSIADRRGKITYVNDAFCVLSGYSREELLGQDHRLVNSGTHSPEFWQDMWRTIMGGETWCREVCNRAKDGSLYWVKNVIAPFVAEKGRVERFISIRTDITAIKDAQRRLAENEAFLERAGSVSGVGGFKMDLVTGEQTWTRQTYRIHEVEESQAPTLELVDSMVSAEVREKLHATSLAALERGEGYDIELPLTTPRGRSIWIRAVGAVEFEGGKPVRIVGAIQDITERKRAQEELRQTSERFRMAAEGAGIGVWEWDLVANRVFWDERMYRLFGADRSRVDDLYAYWSSCLHPDDRERTIAELNASLNGGGTFDAEFRIVKPNGDVRYLQASASVQHDSSGKPLRIAGTNFDITERRRLEESIKASEETFRQAMEHAAIGMALVTPNGRFLKVNAALCELLGYTREKLIETEFQSLTHPDDLALNMEYIKQTLDGVTQTYQLEKRYVHRDGHIVWAWLSVSLVRDADGAPKYFVSQIQDITARKQVDRMKSEFIAAVSHELRTPLTSIRGSLGLISGGATGPISDQVARLVNVAYQNAGRLTLIINDILDAEKIESGKLSLESAAHALAPLLEQSVEQNRGYGLTHKVRFELRRPLPTVSVNVDAGRLLQVLANFLSNAAKFSPPESAVEVSATLQGGTVRVAVTDRGPGIPKEFQPRMFQKFSQADGSDSRARGGTGLGLAIAKSLVEQMGGHIGYRTESGAGTTVFFDLPVVEAMRAAAN
jgi:PAS domain S-box-containing protein